MSSLYSRYETNRQIRALKNELDQLNLKYGTNFQNFVDLDKHFKKLELDQDLKKELYYDHLNKHKF